MVNLAQMSVITVVEDGEGRVRIVASDGGSIREPIAEGLTPDQAVDLMDQLADNGLGAADVGQRGDLLVRAPAWRI